MTLAELKDFIGSVGLPTALVIFACVTSWKWGWYVVTQILLPLGHKGVEFLQHVMDAITKLVDSNEQTNQQMKQQSEHIKAIGDKQDAHGNDIQEIKSLLKK